MKQRIRGLHECARRDDAEGVIELMHLEEEEGAELPVELAGLTPERGSRKGESARLCETLLSMQCGGYWDDARGGWLNKDLVTAAREEEMSYVRKHGVYLRVPRSVCLRETGKQPIKTGWADTNKGTASDPNIRSRWVAKEFNTGPRLELFAPRSLPTTRRGCRRMWAKPTSEPAL